MSNDYGFIQCTYLEICPSNLAPNLPKKIFSKSAPNMLQICSKVCSKEAPNMLQLCSKKLSQTTLQMSLAISYSNQPCNLSKLALQSALQTPQKPSTHKLKKTQMNGMSEIERDRLLL